MARGDDMAVFVAAVTICVGFHDSSMHGQWATPVYV